MGTEILLWENNSLCRSVWTVLKIQGEIQTRFSETADLKIKDLSCWQKAAIPKTVEFNLGLTAFKIDSLLRTIPAVMYRENYNHDTAVTEINKILHHREGSIEDLIRVIDKCYVFNNS